MVAKLLPGLVAPLLFLAAGAGLQACLPRPIERSLPARFGLAYLLGLAWVSLAVWAASFAFGAPVAAPAFLVAAAAPVAAGALLVLFGGTGRRGWSRGESPRTGGGWATWAVSALIAAATLALLADASVNPVTDFDGRMTWGTLARYVAFERDVLPEVLLGESYYVIHPRYPLALPLAQVAASSLSGQPLEGFVVRPVYVLLLPALWMAIAPALARAGGRRGAALAGALLFLAPVLLWNHEVGPRGTFSDFPLAAFLGAGLALLLHPAARREPWRGFVAGLLLAAAAGSKNEGLVLAPVALVAVAFAASWRARRGALLRAGAVLALGALLVVAWRSQIPNRNDEAYFEDFSPAALASGLPDRIGAIVEATSRMSFDLESWGATFWVLPLLLLAGWRGLRHRAARAAALCIAAEVAITWSAYSVVGDFSIVEVTWNRFLVQMLVPLALVAAACAGATLRSARGAPRV